MERDRSLLNDLRQNIPLITAIGAALYIALRILGLGGCDLQTAYAVLQAAGTGNALAGATLGALASMPSLIVLGYLLYFPGRTRYTDAKRFSIIAAIVLFAILAILITPATELAFLLLVIGAARWSSRRNRKRYAGNASKIEHMTSPPETVAVCSTRSLSPDGKPGRKLPRLTAEAALQLGTEAQEDAKKALEMLNALDRATNASGAEHETVILGQVTGLLTAAYKKQMHMLRIIKVLKIADTLTGGNRQLLSEILEVNKELADTLAIVQEKLNERVASSEKGLAQAEKELEELETKRARSPYALALTAVFVLWTTIIVPQAWMLIQNLTIGTGRPFTGYVLSVTDNEVAILQDSPRKVIYIEPSQLRARSNCIPGFYTLSLPLLQLIMSGEPRRYPNCVQLHQGHLHHRPAHGPPSKHPLNFLHTITTA